MKAVLMSIKPKYVELIAKGQKTIEVRKTSPKLGTPFKCYIYCTIGNGVKGDYLVPSGIQCGKVIGHFTCDSINEFLVFENGLVQYWNYHELEKSCLTYEQLSNYIGKGKKGYGWHITDLKIYDKPRELSEFWTIKCSNKRNGCIGCEVKPNCIKRITRPPQSWAYCEIGE